MQIKLTRNSDTNVTLAIVADEQTLTKIKSSTLQNLNSSNLKIAGFRAGKAPLEMVEKHIDPQTLQSEFIDTVLNHYYRQAMIKENLRVIGEPTVDLKKFVPFTTFEFEVTVDVLGDVTLPDYKKIKLAKTEAKIDEAQVKEVVESLRSRLADKKEVTRAAKNGDEVTIDFKGVDAKGEAVNGAEGKDYPLQLGSNSFIPGFEPAVVGVKPGESKTFTIPFPKDYGVKALQGKKVTFTITANKIEELVLPKIDDDFASKAGPFETLKDLKADIKRQLTIEKQNELDRTYETELLRAIAKKTKVAIPDSVIDEQVDRAEQDERQNLVYRGQTWQEHLDGEGVTEEEHRTRNRPDAEEQVKIGIILGAIGDKEEITVTPEELEIRLQLLKGQYTDAKMHEELDKPEGRQDIAARLRSEKIITKLTEYAQK
ncbi:MAG: trigger factor [Candidatus Saccharibacteria bacterium]|nr:trigger factor [Candidatus Saccharibacteria bacterium]